MKRAHLWFVVGALAVAFLLFNNQSWYENVRNLASVFFIDSSTPGVLKDAYRAAQAGEGKVKILIVPGHDDDAWGTEYKGLREADATLALGKELQKNLAQNQYFEVRLARGDSGYDPGLAAYITLRHNDILAYRASQTAQMQSYVASGQIQSTIVVDHNFAPSDVAVKLWGINKWANEQRYDLIIHIHFNDAPRPVRSVPGRYSGFALYVPESQFSNAKGSRAVADSVKNRLDTWYAVSDLPGEDEGLTEEQQLIAIGSNNSVDAAAFLIEYAYIYEPVMQKFPNRTLAISDMALQTSLGVFDFFGATSTTQSRYVPHHFDNNSARGAEYPDVLYLQAALMAKQLYPPVSTTLHDCPLSGRFGLCTQRALREFQRVHQLTQTGALDAETRAALNVL